MNTVSRRRATSFVVSLVLIAVIAVTGVLCAVTLRNKSNNEDVDVVLNKTAYSDYGMQAVVYDDTNSAYTYVNHLDGSRNGYVAVRFPTEIYMDVNENLNQAGYYYRIKTDYESSRGYKNSYTVFADTIFGFYYGSYPNLTAQNQMMATMFKDYGFDFVDVSNCSIVAGNSDGDAANNTTVATINAANAYATGAYRGMPTGTGTGTYVMPTAKKIFGMKYKPLIGSATDVSNSSRSAFNADEPEGGIDGWPNYKSNIEIYICIYDKSGLYTAKQNLASSIKDLTGFATSTSLQAAQDLVDQATDLLKLRKTTQTAIDELKNKMNNFVFDVTSVATSYTGWEYGASGHIGQTFLADIVSGNLRYGASSAKYFDVTIDREIANVWTGTTEADVTKRVYNEATYNLNAYVQDAGTYTIKFTPKTELSDGILHKVRWSNGSTATITSTLTISRATAVVDPPNFDAVRYDGSSHSFSWAAGTNGSIALQGGMTASSGNTTIKLSKTDLRTGASNDWSLCSNSVSFTEVGTHRIYYRLEIDNHDGVGGESAYYFEVTVSKAEVVIDFTTSTKGSTYGDQVLDSTALAGYVIGGAGAETKVNGILLSGLNSGSILGTGGPLSGLLKLGVQVNGVFPIDTADNLSEVGTYSIVVKEFTAITDRSDELVAENSSVTNWGDRLNVTYKNNDYQIQRRTITLDWTYDTTTEYDAASHAPTATVADGLVVGGEEFTPVVSVKEGDTPLVSGGAVWAGSYTANVENTTKNYEISNPDYGFAINVRQIHVSLVNETAGYAQYIGDGSSSFVTADKVLEDYRSKYESDANSVFSFVGSSMAGVDSPLDVFTVDITGVSKTGDYYDAGTHTGALILRLLTEQDDSNANFYLVNSYQIADIYDGTFTIAEASITPGVTEVRLTYNGKDQAFTLAPSDFDLSGYEEENKSASGIVSIGYSRSVNGPFVADAITLKNHSQDATVIYYQVSAKNHTSAVYSFAAYMDRLNIEFNVGDQDIDADPVYYGDDIPTSNELKSHLSITYTATDNKGGAVTEYSIDGKLGYYLLKAGVRVEDNVYGSYATAGAYDLGVESIASDVSLDNFVITFSGRGSAGAFEISKRPLVVDWRQNDWDESSGYTATTYTSYGVTIYPTVRRYRTKDLTYFETHVNGEGSGGAMINDHNGDMYVPNYIGNDSISLKEQYLGVDAGSYPCSTSLTKTYNLENYYLVNDTITFRINPRNVSIVIFDQETTYGNVSNVLLGNLSTNKYRWDYYSSNSDKFVNDKHSEHYMLSVDGLSNSLDAGEYPIVLAVDTASDTTGITNNYQITVYRRMADNSVVESSLAEAAWLTINKAEFDLRQTTFDIDGSPVDDGNYRPMEYCDIDADVIRTIIRLVGGTKPGDVTVYLTEYSEEYPDMPTDDSVWSIDRAVSINGESQIGNFYFYIKLTNKNYEDFTAVITVKRFTSWISITLGGGITAVYGDKLLSSEELFEALRANVTEIIGVMTAEGDQITNAQDAWDMIEARDYFSLNVNNNVNLDTVLAVGSYSIFINVNEANRDGLHFRFKSASNVDIYEITKRPLYIEWDANAQTQYEYGAETEGIAYTVANLVNGDEVIIMLQYGVDDSNGTPGDLNESTVGDYVAYVDQFSIEHDNYKIAVVGVDKKIDGSLVTEADVSFKFSIVPRVITISFDKYDESGNPIDNLTLTYGDLDATRNGIAAFLNSSSVYSIVQGDLGAFVASEVFEIKLADDISAYEYIQAGRYALTVEGKNKNFEIEYDDAAELVVNEANFTIYNLEFANAYFNGSDIKPDIIDETLDFGFIVPTDEHDKIYIQYDGGEWIALENFRLKNAGTYSLNVKVEAVNYIASVRVVDFTIEKATVTISLSAFEKEYGKVLGDGNFATVISDYIKANGKINYAVTSNGETIAISGIEDEFIFYVVAGASAGVNGGESVAEGNFANSVGAYRIYHKFVDDIDAGNYDVTYANDCNAGAYVVTPAEVDVEWFVNDSEVESGDEFVFTGSEIGLEARFRTVTFANGAMTYDYKTLNLNNADGVDVATYTANANFYSAESNYTLNADTASFIYVIIKRTLYIAIDSDEQEYGLTKAEILAGFDNSAWSITGYYDADGWSLDENDLVEYLKDYITLSLDLSAYADDDYVPYTDSAYRIIGANTNGNFNVEFSDDKNAGRTYGIFTIVRADIVYDRAASYEVVYDGTDQEIDFFDTLASHVTLKGDVEWTRDSVKINYTGYAAGELPTIKSGEKAIGFEIAADNHKTTYGTITVVVRKAKVAIMITTTEFEYGSTDLDSQEICEAMNIAINEEEGDPINVDLYEVFNFSVKVNGVGSYALTIEIKDEELKEFIEAKLDSNTDEEQFIVVPKSVNVNWGNTTLTYNGRDQLFEALGFVGEVGNDKITAVTYSVISEGGESAAFGKTVGEYKVKVSINSLLNPNYVIDEDDEYVTFEIVKKEVQIQWTEENFVYDGEAHTLSAQIIGGVVDGDDISLTVSAGFFGAGEHQATASISGADKDNYAVSAADMSKSFTIAPKVVELTWEIKNAVYNKQSHLPEATANGLVGYDICTIEVELISGDGISAGKHVAKAVALSNSNYELPSNVTFEFAIAQFALDSITWSTTSIEYKEVNGHAVAQAPTATASGLPGDTVTLEVSGAGTVVGSYKASVSAVSNPNYTVGASTANATVNFNIVQAENSFDKELVLPDSNGGLPSIKDFESVASKYGAATVRYYTDEACTQEYTGNLTDAANGTYYVVVEVEGTENYKGVSQTFTVAVSGKASNAGIIVGIIAAVIAVLGAGAAIIVVVLKKKKGNNDDSEEDDD